MPNDQTLNDLAVETLTCLKEAQNAGAKYNDFGSVLGVRDEIELIESELRDSLNRAGLRLSRLCYRIRKWEKNDREVALLTNR